MPMKVTEVSYRRGCGGLAATAVTAQATGSHDGQNDHDDYDDAGGGHRTVDEPNSRPCDGE